MAMNETRKLWYAIYDIEDAIKELERRLKDVEEFNYGLLERIEAIESKVE